ncbi:MAG: MmgE/PrpD family protein [Nitrospinota bacterium]
MELAQAVADFVQGWERPRDEPALVERAKLHLLDYAACALGARFEGASDLMEGYVRDQGAAPRAGVLGSELRTSRELAALLNGFLGHLLDFDDTTMSVVGHPSTVLFPALLALGESGGAGGRELLEAYVVGAQVMGKLGGALNPAHYERGWHATSTLGTLAAAAACARLAGLSIPATARALSLSASMASGVRQNFGTMTKPFHAGHAARCAVLAADLAGRGFTASAAALDGPVGFFRLYGEGASPEALARSLDGPAEVLTPGAAIKLYPCCRSTHASLDALGELLERHPLAAEEVEEVECRVDAIRPRILIYDRPRTGLEGKFSMPYCIGVRLLEGGLSLGDFTDARVREPAREAFLPRVRMTTLPEHGGKFFPGSEVVVRTRDGRELRHQVACAKGEAEWPVEGAEVVEKFRKLAPHALHPEGVEACLKTLNEAEAHTAAELVEAARPAGARAVATDS